MTALEEWADRLPWGWRSLYLSPEDWHLIYGAQRELHQILEELVPPSHGYWRATNRKAEWDDVVNGVEIISMDHSTGTPELGMSVSEDLTYAYFDNFKYVYKVDGTVVDEGADGEPILVDVEVLSKIMPTARALKNDKQLEAGILALRTVSDQIVADYHELVDLNHHRF